MLDGLVGKVLPGQIAAIQVVDGMVIDVLLGRVGELRRHMR
jgi:hypothetical protein